MNPDQIYPYDLPLHPISSETLRASAFRKILEARLKPSHDFFSYKGPIGNLKAKPTRFFGSFLL
jgi:hypothetical protein